MSINDTVSQVAANNPYVGAVISAAGINSNLLASLPTDESGLTGVLGAKATEGVTENQILSSLQPNLGQNIDTQA